MLGGYLRIGERSYRHALRAIQTRWVLGLCDNALQKEFRALLVHRLGHIIDFWLLWRQLVLLLVGS